MHMSRSAHEKKPYFSLINNFGTGTCSIILVMEIGN